jgi:hypothetical protein
VESGVHAIFIKYKGIEIELTALPTWAPESGEIFPFFPKGTRIISAHKYKEI